MKCQRAFEADLVAVLRGESGDVEFLAHYPTCADCAAELRVWGELDGLLRAGAPVAGAHPEPETLLAYVDAPATLAASARDGIERHLTGCLVCRDEIGSLRRFDAGRVAIAAAAAPLPSAAAARTMAEPPAPASRGWVPRVLWHPAFAYALVALLLVPVVRDQIGRFAVPARVLDARHQDKVAAAPVRGDAQSAPRQMPAAPSAPEVAAPAPPPAASAPEPERRREAAAEPRAPAAVAKRAAPAESAANEADQPREAAGGSLTAFADRMGGAAAAVDGAPGGDTGETRMVDLRVGEATVIPLALANSGPRLRILTPRAADGPVEVQVRARTGGRQLVQQLLRRANAIAVPIPPHWLAAGDYTITLVPVAAEAASADKAARQANSAALRGDAPLVFGFSVTAR